MKSLNFETHSNNFVNVICNVLHKSIPWKIHSICSANVDAFVLFLNVSLGVANSIVFQSLKPHSEDVVVKMI